MFDNMIQKHKKEKHIVSEGGRDTRGPRMVIVRVVLDGMNQGTHETGIS